MENIKRQIDELRRVLHRHNYLYYVCAAPVITDFEYDKLMNELIESEQSCPEYIDSNSPSQRIGSDLQNGFSSHAHTVPMLSLPNSYSIEEVDTFFGRIRTIDNPEFQVDCELKFDGVSISLIYEDGKLIQALTRGDGVSGDEVTANVRTIRSLPLELTEPVNGRLVVRGELFMPFPVFEELNRLKEESGETLFANPRNATAGSLKLLSPRVVALRRLDYFVYGVYGESLPTDSHFDNLQWLRKLGFKVSDKMRRCTTIDAIHQYIQEVETERHLYPFATDGVVLKVDSLSLQDESGFTTKFPRWATAYKFPPDNRPTRLLGVAYQVGRSGVVTPVAELSPISLSGTIVKRATLHNEDFIRTLDLHEGDIVFVEKGGEIIPKITGVQYEQRDLFSMPITFPVYCPDCGSGLVRDESESAWYCPNYTGCPPQQIARIEHFMGRKAMDIAGGEATAKQLYDAGLVKNAADLYELVEEQLLTLPGWKEKSARKFLDSIQASKTTAYERVLFALGIKYVGEVVAKNLASNLPTITALRSASCEELQQIEDIGQKIAESLVDYFANTEGNRFIDQLIAHGLRFESDRLSTLTSTVLKGKSFVITGIFDLHSREIYRTWVETNGGKIVSSLSSKTSYLLAGSNMGPAKLAKAQELAIPILTETEFLQMIDPKNLNTNNESKDITTHKGVPQQLSLF